MKKSLENVLKSVNIFSDNEIAEALEFFKPITLKQNDFFIREGQVCNKLGFVVSGILRNFYTSSKEDEVTYCLSFPDKIVTAYSSFITQKPTFENIHAITNAELLVLHKNQLSSLIDSNKNWLLFSKILSEQTYLEMENRLLTFQMETAEKRYNDLLKNYPEYLQEIPLKYLASFLGVSQRHLSRIRKNISF